MKFRQFNFNPFHKHKSRSKKKSKIQENLQSQLDSTSGNCHSRAKSPTSNNYDTRSECLDIEQNYGTYTGNPTENERHHWKQEKGHPCLEPLCIDIDIKSQYRLNNDGFESTTAHDQCVQWCARGQESDYDFASAYSTSEKGSDYDTDGNSNTLKRARTRIKTNPWLPSPRLSPASFKSMDFGEVEAMSDSDSGDQFTESSKICAAISSHFSFKENESINNNNDSDLCNSHPCNSIEESSSVHSQFDLRNKLLPLKPRSVLGLQNEETNFRWSIISDGDVSLDLNSPTMDDLREQFSNLEHTVDFEYENNVDTVLEVGDLNPKANRLSIADLLDDDVTSDSTSSLESSITSSDDMTSSAEFSRSRESSIMTDSDTSDVNQLFNPLRRDKSIVEESVMASTTSDEPITTSVTFQNMDDSIDAGYSSLSRDGRMSSSESDSEFMFSDKPKFTPDVSIESPLEESLSEEQEEITSNTESTPYLDSYAAFEEDLFYQFLNQPTGRTFSEVKMSLEDKVNQLRLEKLIVEQKMAEAQEADKIMTQERLRYQQKMADERKNVLLDTLSVLRERLQDQGDRLQRNYSTILTIQQKYLRNRRPHVFVSDAPPNGC